MSEDTTPVEHAGWTKTEAEGCARRFLEACAKLRITPPTLFVVDKVGIEAVVRVGGFFFDDSDARLLYDLVRGEPMVSQLQRVSVAGPWEPRRDAATVEGRVGLVSRYNLVTGDLVASAWGEPIPAPPPKDPKAPPPPPVYLFRWSTEDGHENHALTVDEARAQADEVLKRSRHRWKLVMDQRPGVVDPWPLGRGWLFRVSGSPAQIEALGLQEPRS